MSIPRSANWIHPIVIGAILVALIYLQRYAIRERWECKTIWQGPQAGSRLI